MDSTKLYQNICMRLIEFGRGHSTALIIQYSVEGLTPAFIKRRLAKQNINLSKFTILSQRRKYSTLIASLISKQQQ